MNARATWRLTTNCDNACVFCAQAAPDSDSDPPGSGSDSGSGDLPSREALAELRAGGAEGLSFIGGEPAAVDGLVDAVALARELGFTAVGLQTNARALTRDRARFDALVQAGLSDLHLSIHADTAAAHDYHTGRAGSFEANLRVLDWSTRAGLTAVVTTVITRSNFRGLAKLPNFLKARGVAGWLLEVVRPYGRACTGFARVIPRFGMALPYALHALELSRRCDLSAWIRGAPLCALGPFARQALPETPRNYSDTRCAECAAKPSCAGVDPNYLEVFGDSELRPRKAPKAAPFDAGRQQLMTLFVGVGELVDAPVILSSTPPATEAEAKSEDGESDKRRLPVLQSKS
ncbi:hypothetical protein PPSIR1_25666 [Plesiocystis pacifica SIR-1]|uniref:Radical SAM core domain-containing protein n=1 Tax=Plesiocystis pacifica SIR-1 TaxID=391625 RepID=A6FZE7_9BACT|nr:radical SAM protein [Plesiocystis pacifica]EDM81031.1 hypothetical protein PPSIR1_25666 [Plesiocystis pacifica SIR-1]